MMDHLNNFAAHREEMGELSGKVGEVVDSVTSLEAELQRHAQGAEAGSALQKEQQQVQETLNRVRSELADRLAALEAKTAELDSARDPNPDAQAAAPVVLQ